MFICIFISIFGANSKIFKMSAIASIFQLLELPNFLCPFRA
nr:MAG TPA: hypothetical protein [Bacteriophage sp.]